MKVNVVKNVLKANDIVANENRNIFNKAAVLALNIISSPGSGKTTLLEKTIPALEKQKSIVIVGDLATTRDADRVSDIALQAIQINTGMSCHLYANQISESLKKLKLDEADYVFIENVGNLVCPGEFDLGENLKVVLLSVPEGDDKVAKYPTIFRVADVVLLTKSDLLGILDFDIQRVKDDIAKLNANVTFIEISSKTSSGMEEWIAWLKEKRGKSVGQQARFVTEE
ncbi:MAG: hydrogenase nickel incorporation protein HypB [Candidatus Omnitrophica bacterium]|nr:hydrogenase nickel incorporation protein HypB [Candidatus Omnitrophota bacterium]MBU1996965.1 hydrogenase nickel incorporation protein HypB [Candidatus Omnitrophota bacterium]